MDIRYIIGVDGGGSGTRARLSSADGAVLGVGSSGPSALGQGVAQAWLHIQQAVTRAFENAGLVPAAPAECVLGLGLAGAHVATRRQAFMAAAPGFARVVLHDDGTTSLHGALQGRPGSVIACGTGSIGEALREDGTRVTVGGWGFGIGDEGSGAWLGLKAVRHAHRVQDGRAEAGPMARAIAGVIGRSREAMLGWGETAGQAEYARFAPLVFDFEAEDPVAASLLAEAVRALELMAHALDPDARLPLVVTGTLGQRLKGRFAPALQARLVGAAGDSADGALLLARRALAGGR